MSRAFTTRYGKRADLLQAQVGVCLPEDTQKDQVQIHQYIGIWDTGATNSAITKDVIERLGLKPIRLAKIYHAGGKALVNVYLINLILEDDVMIMDVEVTEAELINDHISDHEQFHVLIGMDIIGTGDMAITNFHQKTTLTFRTPSVGELDFTVKRKNS